MKYRCLILDHDDTVVASEESVNYPCFLEVLESSWFIRYSGEKASPFGRGGHLTLEMPKCLLLFFSQVISQQLSGVLGPGDPPSCWTLGKKALGTVLCGCHPPATHTPQVTHSSVWIQ